MSDIRFHVRRYIEEGWAVVPIAPGEKGARDGGWLQKARNKEYTIEHFEADANVGVVPGAPSGDRVDVDLDTPEAVAAAHVLLPQTQLIHGRPSRPSTHWWFHVPGAVARSYKDPVMPELKRQKIAPEDAKDGLLEIRAGNGQTVMPPSTHSGEVLAWEMDRAPMTLSVDALEKAVATVAIAALLARYWPRGKGSRHGITLATAGFLGRYIDDAMTVEQIIRVAATQAGDEEIELRMTAVRDTLEKLATDGAKVTGGPRFREEFPHGEKISSRILDWLGQEGADLVDRMNERFFRVTVGTKPVVAEPQPDGILLWTYEDFDKQFCHEKVFAGKGKQAINAGKFWREHARGARFGRLVYAPPPQVAAAGDYNGWRGFRVEPREGSWARNRDHFFEVICGRDEAVYRWFFNWCANLVQHPGQNTFSGVVMRGGQGVGKDHLAVEMLGRLFDPRHFIAIRDRRQIFGDWTDVLSGRSLVYMDESTWGGDKRDAAILKGFVTATDMVVTRKHLPAVVEKSMLHLIAASNEEWPIGIDPDDRRWCVLEVRNPHANSDAYFGPLHEELAAGGRGAFLADLLAYPVDLAALRHPPQNAAKRDLKLRSLPPDARWWFGKLWDGQVLSHHQKWEREVPTAAVYDDYVDTLQKGGTSRRAFETELGQMMTKFVPTIKKVRRGADRKYYWVLPELAECRQAFADAMKSTFEWPEFELSDPDRKPQQGRF